MLSAFRPAGSIQRALLTDGRIIQAEDDPGRPVALPGGYRRILMSIVVSYQIPASIERGWQRLDVIRQRRY